MGQHTGGLVEKDKALKNLKKRSTKIELISKDLAKELERRYPKNLHKQLWGYIDHKAENTLYKWWWEFMDASHKHPALRQELLGNRAKAAAIAKNDSEFGPLRDKFLDWWHYGRGSGQFAENGVPLIHVFAPGPDDRDKITRDGVIVQIPMTISKELILEQIAVMLEIYHPDDELRPYDHSTATIKLASRARNRDADYNFMLEVWKARQKHPQHKLAARSAGKKSTKKILWRTPWWEIYCIAKNDEELRRRLSPHAMLNELDESSAASERARLTKLTERAYARADLLMRNAICGTFPSE
ncbi:hypothetical protein [Dongia sp.]|uniref:hypothetical protein n=1 Tax=Dongia sp. TaxID=1977262 RepID=UPI0034A3E6C0